MTVNSLDNSVLNNAGDGAELLASEQVVLTFNSTRDQFRGNNNSGFHALTTDSSAVQLDFRNVLATDNVESGFNSLAQGDSSLQIVVTSPVDPLFTAGTGSSFSNNGQNGLFFATRDASFVSVTLDNVDVNTNPLNGLSVNRQGASLFLGTAFNSSFSDNTENGILFTGLGSDPADPSQPPYSPGRTYCPYSCSRPSRLGTTAYAGRSRGTPRECWCSRCSTTEPIDGQSCGVALKPPPTGICQR